MNTIFTLILAATAAAPGWLGFRIHAPIARTTRNWPPRGWFVRCAV